MDIEKMITEPHKDSAASVCSDSTHIDTPPPFSVATGDFDNQAGWTKPGGGEGEAVPWGGETFVIRHRVSGRPVTVNNDGAVKLASLDDNLGVTQCSHWKCVDKDGWFGFKHAGRYLSLDIRHNFQADSRWQKSHENFCVRPHPDGGYQIMSQHRWGFRYMDVAEDGQKLVATTNGALWDFYKV